MNDFSSVECLVYGSIISVVVSVAKGVPFVKQYPKIVCFILSVAVAVITTLVGDDTVAWKPIALCILTQPAAAIGTHEAVVQPVKKQVSKTPV